MSPANVVSKVAGNVAGGRSVSAMLVWIDLEMTGLDHRVHRVIEIATIVTDDQLETVIEGPNLVISTSDEDLAQMSPEVTEMHTKTGLLDDIKKSTTTLAEAEEQTCTFIKDNVANPAEVPLCGNSIGTDRRFLDQYMPKVESMLHYRVVDVSSLRLVGKVLVPDVIKGWRNKEDAAEKDESLVKHRALDDIQNSINELRFYYEHWLQRPDAPDADAPDDGETGAGGIDASTADAGN